MAWCAHTHDATCGACTHHMNTCTHTMPHVHTHTHTFTHAQSTHTCMHTYIHPHTRARTSMHTLTHAPTHMHRDTAHLRQAHTCTCACNILHCIQTTYFTGVWVLRVHVYMPVCWQHETTQRCLASYLVEWINWKG